LKVQIDFVVGPRFQLDGDNDFACVGKLDRIAQQIHDDLSDSARIAKQMFWHIAVNPPGEFQALLMGA
jgi:hypothetical protein